MAPGLDLGLGLAAGCGRGALTVLGGCLAAVLGFGRVAGAGLVGAWALVAAGLLAVGGGFGGRQDDVRNVSRIASGCVRMRQDGVRMTSGNCQDSVRMASGSRQDGVRERQDSPMASEGR